MMNKNDIYRRLGILFGFGKDMIKTMVYFRDKDSKTIHNDFVKVSGGGEYIKYKEDRLIFTRYFRDDLLWDTVVNMVSTNQGYYHDMLKVLSLQLAHDVKAHLVSEHPIFDELIDENELFEFIEDSGFVFNHELPMIRIERYVNDRLLNVTKLINTLDKEEV